MFASNGIWLPDGEQYLQTALDETGGYQANKLAAAVGYTGQRRCAVDVGAHVGTWSRKLAGLFETVHAFEPVPEFTDCFHMNVARPNVILHSCALGKETGRTIMYPHATSSAKSRVETKKVPIQKYKDRVNAPIETFDSFGLLDVDFIKIDCEGFELFVIQGGEQTIRRDRPVMIVEQKPGNGAKYDIGDTDAVNLLLAWGANVVDEMNGDYILKWG